MSDDRLMRIAVAFARSTATPAARLCTACVEVLAVSGAGIMVMTAGEGGPLCVSDERIRVLEEVQFTTGEGPGRDAYRSRIPVSAPTLDADASEHWPAFVEMALDNGIGAVFAFPLSSKGATVGVLTIYQDVVGALSAVQLDDGVALAEVLTEAVLSLQDAQTDGVLAPGLDEAVAYRAQIHQASGMVAFRLKVSTGEALSRMRAYAFANDRPLEAVAGDIVGRRLRLADDREQGASK